MFRHIMELFGPSRIRMLLHTTLLIGASGASSAQTPEAFIPGTTINIVGGFNSGGSYDA